MRIVAAMLMIGLVAAVADVAAREMPYRVYFSKLELASDEGERISGLRFWVKCGRITGMSHIPRDWLIEMTAPGVEEVLLVASSNHGASYLTKLGALSGAISVLPTDMSCFDIGVAIQTDGREVPPGTRSDAQHIFGRGQLKLRP